MKLLELTDSSVKVFDGEGELIYTVHAPTILPETIFKFDGYFCSKAEAIADLESLPKNRDFAVAYFDKERDWQRISYFEKTVKELRLLKKAYKNIVMAKVIDDSTIECPSRGSMLNKKFLKTNYCPLCGKNLVPQSWKDEFSKINITIQNYENEIKKVLICTVVLIIPLFTSLF